jgi:signal transduction histidine kinase
VATGVAFAALTLLGLRAAPVVALGALTINLFTGAPGAVAFIIAIGNTLEAVVGAWILRRAGFHPALDRARDVVTFVICVLIVTPLSAAVAIFALRLGGVKTDLMLVFRVWWLGDAIGGLLVAPLVLTWRPPIPWNGRRVAEAAILIVLQTGISVLIFRGEPRSLSFYSWAVFPGLVWAALRLGLPSATLAMLATAGVAIWGTARDLGPFAAASLLASLRSLQIFMGVVGATTLLLAAAVEERRIADLRREKTLHVVSHDLKNPLTVVRTGIELVRRLVSSSTQPPQVKETLDRVERATRRMQRVLSELVESARLEAGTLPLELARTRPSELVDEALLAVRARLAERHVAVELRNQAGDLEVPLDRHCIMRVLENLLGNATKFTPEGGKITVCLSRTDGEVRFGVCDSGPGVPPDKRECIFEPYYQVERYSEGLGLGLYIAKGFVQAHHGHIWVECAPGGGAAFYFTLPIA